MARRSSKRERFDDDGNDVGRLKQLADVDIVELDEMQAVDGNEWRTDADVLGKDAAERLADVGIERDHQWKPSRQAARHGLSDAVRHGAQARVVWLALPRQRHRYGCFALNQVEPTEAESNRVGDPVSAGIGLAQAGVHDGQVAQRQHGRVADVHGITAQLDAELRGAEDGGANAFAQVDGGGGQATVLRRPLQSGGQVWPEVAETCGLSAVDVLGYAARPGHSVGLEAI